MYYNDCVQANYYFNLLSLASRDAPLPENTAFSVSIDLHNIGNSYAPDVKQTIPSVKRTIIFMY